MGSFWVNPSQSRAVSHKSQTLPELQTVGVIVQHIQRYADIRWEPLMHNLFKRSATDAPSPEFALDIKVANINVISSIHPKPVGLMLVENIAHNCIAIADQ